jgi:rRNA-processing protein FCF1
MHTDGTTAQSLLVVVDTNIVLHCKPLAELPWEQFGVAAVDVLLVDPVLVELDAWKGKGNDARAKRVRSMLPLLRQLLEAEDFSITVAQSKCRVRVRMLAASLNDASSAADADGAIVTAAEKVAAEAHSPVILVTRDVVMALRARRRGVPYRFVAPDDADWNARPEAVDADHAETVRKLREYESQHPELYVEAGGDGLAVDEQSMSLLVPLPPKKFDMTSVIATWAMEEFQKPRWRDRELHNAYWKRQIVRLEQDLMILVLKRLRFGPIVRLTIGNRGSMNADDVQIEIMIEGHWRLRAELLDLQIQVPRPPREDRHDAPHLYNLPDIPVASRPRDDEPEWLKTEDSVLDGTSRLVAHISVLRHRSEANLHFHLGPMPDHTEPGKLIVRVSSARQPGFELVTWSVACNAPDWSRHELVAQLRANGELSFEPGKD